MHRYTTEFGYRYNNRTETPLIKFHDAVENSYKKRLKYNKLIGEGRKKPIVEEPVIKEEIIELTPEQKFLDLLDNLDPNSIPNPPEQSDLYP